MPWYAEEPMANDCIFRNLSRVGVLPSVAALGSCVITFPVMGAAALALLEAVWHVDDAMRWYELSCGFALAFLLGFIVPGAPGGIGIREVFIVVLLSTTIGAGLALRIAVLLRFASIVGDFLRFAIACSIREHTA